MHLYSITGGGSILYIYLFSTIAAFILLIACINFMNLSTARGSVRAKEVGLRKVVGARRKHLIHLGLFNCRHFGLCYSSPDCQLPCR